MPPTRHMEEAAEQGDCIWFPDLRCGRGGGRHEGFVAPMTMPYLFEEPFSTTGAQLLGLWHQTPNDSVFRGGDAGVIALQVRLALTDRLSFIATKDGFVMLRPDTQISDISPALPALPLLSDENEFADITIGFKYTVVDMPEHQFALAPALRYEIPLGAHSVFQGTGDGVLIPSVSAAKGFGRFHALVNFGVQVALDTDRDTTSIFWNIHLDYALFRYLVPWISVNAMHWTSSGDGLEPINTTLGRVTLTQAQTLLRTGPGEGFDYANLGSRGISGASVVTLAGGIRVPLTDHIALGLAYEGAVTSREDIFGQRLTLAVSYEF